MNTAEQYLMYTAGENNSYLQQELAAFMVKDTLSKPKTKKQFFDELSNELLNFEEIRRVLINCREQQKENFKNFIQTLNNYFDWLPSARDTLRFNFMNNTSKILHRSENNADFEYDFIWNLSEEAEKQIVGKEEDFKETTNGYYFMFGFDLISTPVLHKMPERNLCFRFATKDEKFCNTIEYGWQYGSKHFEYHYPFTLKSGSLFQILHWYSNDNSFAIYQFDKPTEQLQTFYNNWKRYKSDIPFPLFRTSPIEYLRLMNDIDFLLFHREMFIEYYNFLYQQWEKNSFFNDFSLIIEQTRKYESFSCSFFLGENDQLMQRPALSKKQKDLLISIDGKNKNLYDYDQNYFLYKNNKQFEIKKQIDEILQMKPIPATDELKKQLAAALTKFSKISTI